MAHVDFRSANELHIDCECPRTWVSVLSYNGDGSVRTRCNMTRISDAVRSEFGNEASCCGFRHVGTFPAAEVHLLVKPEDVVLELVSHLLDRIRAHAWLCKEDMLHNTDAVREEAWRNARPTRRIAMLRAANAPIALALQDIPPLVLQHELVLEGAAL